MAQLRHRLPDDRGVALSSAPKVNDGGLAPPRAEALGAPVTAQAEPSDGLVALTGQLNGSLTALMLYMGEIKQRSDDIARTPGDRRHVQMIVDNALMQTERICTLVSQMAGAQPQCGSAPRSLPGQDSVVIDTATTSRHPGRTNKSLTPREREVLELISAGHSNKEGALRMGISPRTFESHRAEAMRKLGARNTAELVRAALLNQIG